MVGLTLRPPSPPPEPEPRIPIPLHVTSNFTWPEAAERFSFTADGLETSEDLTRRLAAKIGYLVLDVLVLRAGGAALAPVGTLSEQGLKAGDDLLVLRRSSLPAGAGVIPADAMACQERPDSKADAKGPSSSASAATGVAAAMKAMCPSSAILERYCRSAFTLSCVEALPRAPVLLRILQLDHGCVPDLHARCALQHAVPATDLQQMLAAMGALPEDNQSEPELPMSNASSDSGQDHTSSVATANPPVDKSNELAIGRRWAPLNHPPPTRPRCN